MNLEAVKPMPGSGGWTSEERQKARLQLLDEVNKAEAEFFDARERAEKLRRDATQFGNIADEKRRVLVAAQEKLKGFLISPK